MATNQPRSPAQSPPAQRRPSQASSTSSASDPTPLFASPSPDPLCPVIREWGPVTQVKLGRVPGQTMAGEACFVPSQLEASLARLYRSAAPCNIYGISISGGYVSQTMADELNQWWTALTTAYWETLDRRRTLRDPEKFALATLPATVALPGYLEDSTRQFRSYGMACTVTICNLSGAAVVIDLNPYKELPTPLRRFLQDARFMKVTLMWLRQFQLLVRRFPDAPSGESMMDLFQTPGGWLNTLTHPVGSLEELVMPLLNPLPAASKVRDLFEYRAETHRTLAPLVCEQTWLLTVVHEWKLCQWMLDLALINYSPPTLSFDGRSDPVITALHQLTMAHRTQYPQLYPGGMGDDAVAMCDRFRTFSLKMPAAQCLYYDVYRLLLQQYMVEGSDNAFIIISEPLRPEATEYFAYPGVQQVIPESYSISAQWPGTGHSEIQLRILVRTMLSSMQLRLKRVDISWLNEELPGQQRRTKVTAEDVARYASWMQQQMNEIKGQALQLKREYYDMRRVARLMHRIRHHKVGVSATTQFPPWQESDDEDDNSTDSQSPVAPALPQSTSPADTHVSTGEVLTAAASTVSLPPRSAPSLPQPTSPADTHVSTGEGMNAAESTISLPPMSPIPIPLPPSPVPSPMPTSFWADVSESIEHEPEVEYQSLRSQRPQGELAWGKSFRRPHTINSLGRPVFREMLHIVRQKQENARLDILEALRRFVVNYTDTHSESNEEQRTRRDFLLAVLYAQFPTVDVYPPLYAFNYPYTPESLLNRDKMAHRAVIPNGDGTVGNWWEEQNRLLGLANPALKVAEPAYMLHDIGLLDETPTTTFNKVFSAARLYYAAYTANPPRNHPPGVVPHFRTPVLRVVTPPPPGTPYQYPPSAIVMSEPQNRFTKVKTESTTPGPSNVVPETTPKPGTSQPPATTTTAPKIVKGRGRGRGYLKQKALSLPTLVRGVKVSFEEQPGTSRPAVTTAPTVAADSRMVPAPPSHLATIVKGEIQPGLSLIDQQFALRRLLAEEVQLQDQQTLAMRKDLEDLELGVPPAFPAASVTGLTELFNTLPSDATLTPETSSSVLVTNIDLGDGNFQRISDATLSRTYRLADHELFTEVIQVRREGRLHLPGTVTVPMDIPPPSSFAALPAPEAPLTLGPSFSLDWDNVVTDMTPITFRSPERISSRPPSPPHQ